MTVSSRKTAAGIRYRWDFERAGQRFNSPTTYPTRAKAAKAEREAKKAAERDGAPAIQAPRKKAAERRVRADAGGPVSLGRACDRYWDDVARHHRSASDIERRLKIVRRLLGDETPLLEIRFADINAAVQARRAEPGRQGKPLSAGSVNRDIIDALRPAWNHAGEVFELALPRIAWGKLRLKEAAEIVREFAPAEAERWAAELASDAERLFLDVALSYGPRLGEMFFPPNALKLDAGGGAELELGRYLGRAGVWRDSRKDGSLHTVTILPDHAERLAALAAEAKARGLPHCWFEVGRGARKGDAIPISYYAMAGRLRSAAARAGIPAGRIVHGMRHHAVTSIVRTAGLAMGQRLAGHKQITTTRRYAHLANDDLRAALERAAGAKSTPKSHARTTPEGKAPQR